MPHQRFIKAEFFTDIDMGELQPLCRLFYVGLWTQADKRGVLEDRPRQLKARVMPYDDFDAEVAITELVGRGKLIRYKVGDKRYLQVASWKKNQSTHASEKDSGLPESSQATEIVALPLINRLDNVSSPSAIALSESCSAPVPVPVPVPVPGPGVVRAPTVKNRQAVTVEKPTLPREEWRFEEFEDWVQWLRLKEGLPPEDKIPIFERDPTWQVMLEFTGGSVRLLCDGLIRFSEDKYWEAKGYPLRGFLSQWKKYVRKESSRAAG